MVGACCLFSRVPYRFCKRRLAALLEPDVHALVDFIRDSQPWHLVLLTTKVLSIFNYLSVLLDESQDLEFTRVKPGRLELYYFLRLTEGPIRKYRFLIVYVVVNSGKRCTTFLNDYVLLHNPLLGMCSHVLLHRF